MAGGGLKPGWYLLGALVLATAAALGGRPLLRRLDFFRVRRVEISGLQNLSADAVLTGLKIPTRSSVFDDLAPLRRRAQSLPGISEAMVSRRLPGTIRVKIRETAPVALVARGGPLVLMDARGRALPFDPARSAPDLPLAESPDSLVGRLLAQVRDVDPGLFARVAAARREEGDVVLDLGAQRWWFRPDASAEVIRAVVAVSQDLARKGRAYRELDGRFAGQVVVRWGHG